MSSSSERVVLSNLDGIGRKGGVDEHGQQWEQFELDPFCGECECEGPECDPDTCPRFVTECSICGELVGSGWVCLDGGEDACCDCVEFAEDAGEELEPWDGDGLVYHDWTSPCGSYRVQTRYDRCEGNRTYLAYRLWCRGKLVFAGDDFGCSPLHADDSWASLSALLGFLSLRPGDTDTEYFRNYTSDQLAFAQEHGEELGALASDMETRDSD